MWGLASSQGYLLSVRQSTYSFNFSSRSSCWPCSSAASPPARSAGQPCVLTYPRESPQRPCHLPPALTKAVLGCSAMEAGAFTGGAAGLTDGLIFTGT